MSNKKCTKRIPRYAFGEDSGEAAAAEKATQWASGLGDLSQVAGTMLQGLSSGADSGAAVAGSALSGAGSLASAGASIGGPIGAAVGGGVGLIGGLIGGIRRRRQMRKLERERDQVRDTQAGLNNAADAEERYWENNDTAYTYANGGIVPDLAYVDNGEVLRDYAGNLTVVPNTRPGTDNHLIDASNLESVLSDRLKVPGTNRTFAQEGRRIARRSRASEGADRFADATNTLNRANANAAYNELLVQQEQVKAQRNIRPKSKAVPAYADGDGNEITYPYRTRGTEGVAYRIGDDGNVYFRGRNGVEYTEENGPGFLSIVDNETGEMTPVSDIFRDFGNRVGNWLSNHFENPFSTTSSRGFDRPTMIHTPGFFGTRPYYVTPQQETPAEQPGTYPPPIYQPEQQTTQPVVEEQPVRRQNVSTRVGNTQGGTTPAQPAAPEREQLMQLDPLNPAAPSVDVPDVNIDLTYRGPRFTPTASTNPGDENTGWSPNLSWTGSLAELAPTFYNLVQGMRGPEDDPLIVNPMQGAATRAMARRRMNIEPILRENRRSRAIANYNAANVNANTGMNLALRAQQAASEYNANANAFATRDNYNNQYLADYANTLNNFGKQWVNSVGDWNQRNAQNRATARNFTGTGLSQLSSWYQNEEQMRNQAARDQLIIPFMADFLRQGYTSEQVNNLVNRTRTGR